MAGTSEKVVKVDENGGSEATELKPGASKVLCENYWKNYNSPI